MTSLTITPLNAGSVQAKRKRIPQKNFMPVFILKNAVNQPGICHPWPTPGMGAERSDRLRETHFCVFINLSVLTQIQVLCACLPERGCPRPQHMCSVQESDRKS